MVTLRKSTRRIDHGDGAGKLIGCVNTVMRADWYVRPVEGCQSGAGAMDHELAVKQEAQSSRHTIAEQIIAEMNGAEEFICRRIADRDRVRGLVGCLDAVCGLGKTGRSTDGEECGDH